MSNYDFNTKPVDVLKVQTNYRRIQTAIPAPGTEKILEKLHFYESRSMHGQLPIIWDEAKDAAVFDIAKNKWIDFTSGIFVASIGHSNRRLIEKLKETLDAGLLHTYAYAHELRAEYHDRLTKFSGFDKAFLLSAGTEATEAALKLMRMNSQKIGKKRPGVICIRGNWHGRTMGAQMMSSNAEQKAWIGFQDPNIHYINFPYPWVLQGKTGAEFLASELLKLQKESGLNFDEDIAGFMLETFQGWGAVFYPIDFAQGIKKFCDQHSCLLTFDEMQSGFARTGKKFGYEHYDVQPDLICCGKGMGGGLPLSGVLGRKELMDLPEVGNMSSTHSANPLVCAAGLATLDEISDKGLVEQAKKKGEILHERLNQLMNKFPNRISYVFGKGLIASMLFQKDSQPDSEFASKLSERCMQKGLLVVHTGRESVKIGPPLVIDEEALIEGCAVIEESMEEIIREEGV